jgi:hypothetical protein
MKKRKKISVTPEERARWEANQRKLAERIAYHKAKLAEERGERS